MSDKVFLDIVNMSITGSFAILIIILARLLLKKTPKVFSYALWFVAFFRLLVPVSFESVLSILPFNTTPLSTDMLYIETPYVETGIKAIDSVINPVVATEVFGSNANVYQIFTYVKNQDKDNTGNVAGLLLYAKTDEAITPDCMFNMGGNQIGAKTLDLNVDFKVISAQRDKIAEDFFGAQVA